MGKRDKNRCIEQPGVDICCKENLREVRAILYMVGVCVYGGGGFSEEFYMWAGTESTEGIVLLLIYIGPKQMML